MVRRSHRRPSASLVAAIAVMVLMAAACGNEEGTTVDVTVREFEVIPVPDSAPAGDITFYVTNEGPDDIHELVVFATDLQPDALPTNPDGSVDETGEGVELIGEIEDIPVGQTMSTTLTLDPGSYVLICNIVEDLPDGTVESHYQEGMRVAFTAE
jgi:hypothetical protein